ncbi:MAG: Holliday junction resolvase [Rickettsiales bacterium]|nr:Holliday junction resolvase [Rickettsiales bacterium]
MMDAILAFDLGMQTGWALLTEGRIFSGSESFHTSRFSGGGMRFLRFRHFLDSLKQKADIKAVYFEEVRRHLGVDAAHIYGGFLAHLTAWCEDHEIPYQGVGVGTIKRHATGKGNASKEEIITAIKAKGFNPVDYNEADSLALLLWAQDNMGVKQ